VARLSIITLAVLGTVVGVVFALDSALDIEAATYFLGVASRPDMHAIVWMLDFLRQIGPLIIVAAIAPVAIALVMKLFWPRRTPPMTGRAALFLLLSLAIGPGLLVNGTLKESWARPRPGSVTEFGGDLKFMPWWDPRGSCDSNCSFVSGETSSATWLAAPALLVPPPWRAAALGTAAIYAAIIGLSRMVAGGHFLSDVLFAAILTGVVIWGMHGLFYRWFAARFDNQSIDRALERVGAVMLSPFFRSRRSAGATGDLAACGERRLSPDRLPHSAAQPGEARKTPEPSLPRASQNR
jgi:lipid A 4'-phosphatase